MAHGYNDGLEANPNGEVHGVIIPVPVSVMEKAGTYRFVLHFYDDYADSYKNHQVKAALETNGIPAPLQFTVFTDPEGDSQTGHPGHTAGARGTMKFYVVLKAQLFWSGSAPPPFSTVRFLLIRSATGERGRKTGFLVTDPKDPDGPKPFGNGRIWTYRTEHKVVNGVTYTHWIVTEKKGKWTILISPPHHSNEVKFKINKRQQIVILAESRVGAPESEVGGLCWTLASRVYTQLGFPLPASSGQYKLTIPDNTRMNGCLIFYTYQSPDNLAHVAIQVDLGFVVDINCLHIENKDIHPDPFVVRRHVFPRGYLTSERRSPPELIFLDGE